MDLVNHLEGRLLFAVPKKGRLNEPTLKLLEGADIQFHRSPRLDIALAINHPIALVFLGAADIPRFVAKGRVDLGITGWDQVLEYEASPRHGDGGVDGEVDGSRGNDELGEHGQGIVVGKRRKMEVVMDLEFGKCKLQVQVPERGNITQPRQLVGKEVVTSFEWLTERYFARLEAEEEGDRGGAVANGTGGIGESREDSTEPGRRKLRTEIDYVGGSVEIACSLGGADGVVDLVESGETMRAAGLVPIATLVSSTAVLLSSTHPSNRPLVALIASRIKGVITAQRYVLCQYNIPRRLLPDATKITPGRRAPTVTALDRERGGEREGGEEERERGGEEWVAVSSMVVKKEVAGAMDRLTEVGATDILVLGIENSRTG